MGLVRERWNELPRAGRWLIAAGVIAFVYFVGVEPVLDATATLSARADALQWSLDRSHERQAEDSDVGRALALSATRFGEPLLPSGTGASGAENRAAALNARIESVLRDRSLRAVSIRARAPTSLGREVMAAVLGPDDLVQRLVIDLDFEAEPDLAMAVIADLERAPEVASIGRISLRRLERDGQKLIQVSVSPEGWIITRRGERR